MFNKIFKREDWLGIIVSMIAITILAPLFVVSIPVSSWLLDLQEKSTEINVDDYTKKILTISIYVMCCILILFPFSYTSLIPFLVWLGAAQVTGDLFLFLRPMASFVGISAIILSLFSLLIIGVDKIMENTPHKNMIQTILLSIAFTLIGFIELAIYIPDLFLPLSGIFTLLAITVTYIAIALADDRIFLPSYACLSE